MRACGRTRAHSHALAHIIYRSVFCVYTSEVTQSQENKNDIENLELAIGKLHVTRDTCRIILSF
jgi:hypothetical protein